ncbi:hypothetical protein SCG7086_AA_00320 [Chlamydiales bacterium SCGC AG-110-P3]|nr:hypothetical protein SCG7086_AA_00320 [Chlamydiales bacterium SCGC AG-110-P3]
MFNTKTISLDKNQISSLIQATTLATDKHLDALDQNERKVLSAALAAFSTGSTSTTVSLSDISSIAEPSGESTTVVNRVITDLRKSSVLPEKNLMKKFSEGLSNIFSKFTNGVSQRSLTSGMNTIRREKPLDVSLLVQKEQILKEALEELAPKVGSFVQTAIIANYERAGDADSPDEINKLPWSKDRRDGPTIGEVGAVARALEAAMEQFNIEGQPSPEDIDFKKHLQDQAESILKFIDQKNGQFKLKDLREMGFSTDDSEMALKACATYIMATIDTSTSSTYDGSSAGTNIYLNRDEIACIAEKATTATPQQLDNLNNRDRKIFKAALEAFSRGALTSRISLPKEPLLSKEATQPADNQKATADQNENPGTHEWTATGEAIKHVDSKGQPKTRSTRIKEGVMNLFTSRVSSKELNKLIADTKESKTLLQAADLTKVVLGLNASIDCYHPELKDLSAIKSALAIDGNYLVAGDATPSGQGHLALYIRKDEDNLLIIRMGVSRQADASLKSDSGGFALVNEQGESVSNNPSITTYIGEDPDFKKSNDPNKVSIPINHATGEVLTIQHKNVGRLTPVVSDPQS